MVFGDRLWVCLFNKVENVMFDVIGGDSTPFSLRKRLPVFQDLVQFKLSVKSFNRIKIRVLGEWNDPPGFSSV